MRWKGLEKVLEKRWELGVGVGHGSPEN